MQINYQLERFAKTLHGVLCEPVTTLSQLTDEPDSSRLAEAVSLVLLVFMLDGLRVGGGSIGLLIVNGFLSCLGGLILWLSVASIPAVAAMCFNIQYATVKSLLVTTSWSFVPWLFAAPLKLYGLALGKTFVCFASFILVGWTAWLMYLAIKETFHFNN
ncbi:MAG: hypothetical protein HY711_02085 [Candidatus Melainabacteria bacterium]|nr:hypothetical protein [Candidatus Melainabacteria bacterium]